ncbi:MAG: heavy-metal-associated domain-containing protein [Ferruginibacter sp.]
MKNLLLAIALICSANAFVQIQSVNLQASGLTCSMCSNSINKALKSLDYVDDVKANIKNSTFEISFKPNAKVDFDELKKKVEDAGFHVAKLNANVRFNNMEVEDDSHVKMDGMVFHFLNVKSQALNGETTIQVLDKGFVPTKEFKKNEALTKMTCYKTGVAGTCCSKEGIAAGSRIYHVTI